MLKLKRIIDCTKKMVLFKWANFGRTKPFEPRVQDEVRHLEVDGDCLVVLVLAVLAHGHDHLGVRALVLPGQ